jgi:hypothetical protein
VHRPRIGTVINDPAAMIGHDAHSTTAALIRGYALGDATKTGIRRGARSWYSA